MKKPHQQKIYTFWIILAIIAVVGLVGGVLLGKRSYERNISTSQQFKDLQETLDEIPLDEESINGQGMAEEIDFDFSPGQVITPTARLAGKELTLDIAATVELRSRGLSGRPSLEKDRGMFFVFEDVGNYGFWMKDMLIPIDIIWFGPDLRVLHIEHDLQPESYPDTFGRQVKSQYVLEVNAGWAKRNGVAVGDKIDIDL